MTEGKRLLTILFTLCFASACDKGDADDGAGESESGGVDTTGGESESGDPDTTGGAGLEIAGQWIDNYMQMHDITDASWTQSGEFGVFPYAIDHYDNAARIVIAEDEMATWNKFEWTYDPGGALWYCQTAFGAATPEQAEAARGADPTDPATGGCGGMFPWTRLDPA